MDEVDRAQLEIEIHQLSLINNREKPATIEATGYCLNCDEKLEPCPKAIEDQEQSIPQRWCDEDCRDDWEARETNGQF